MLSQATTGHCKLWPPRGALVQPPSNRICTYHGAINQVLVGESRGLMKADLFGHVHNAGPHDSNLNDFRYLILPSYLF